MCHLVHEVQNYWVEVLGQQLEEKDDRHWEVDNEEGHSNYVPLSSKLLSQRIGVVYIVSGTIHDEPARIEREDEGNVMPTTPLTVQDKLTKEFRQYAKQL